MAKDQNLILNSTKISGACGRLLCCLAYEHEAYCSVKKNYPHEGSVLRYKGKTVTLTELNVLRQTATLRTGDHTIQVVSLEELSTATRKPKKEKSSRAASGGAQKKG
jgi:cell fate regulator YaaT (PSP1 superfamily)